MKYHKAFVEGLSCIIPVRKQRCFNVYIASTTSERRRINVETTLCAYWVICFKKSLHRYFHLNFFVVITRYLKMRWIVVWSLFYVNQAPRNRRYCIQVIRKVFWDCMGVNTIGTPTISLLKAYLILNTIYDLLKK